MNTRLTTLIVLFFFSILLSYANVDGRKSFKINQNWLFKKQIDKEVVQVDLPHTWNNIDAMDEEAGFFRGKGIYTKSISLDNINNKKFFLFFEGAATITKVYCNDHYCGEHIGSYGSFYIDITKTVKLGNNQIKVEVDNSFHKQVAPLSADFTFMGGLYRNVSLVETGGVCFNPMNHGANGVKILTPNVSDKSGELLITSDVLNSVGLKRNIVLQHHLYDNDGRLLKTITKKIGKSNIEDVTQKIEVTTPNLWSPESPYLYQLVSEIKHKKSGVVYDRVVNNVGFRWYDYNPEEGLKLNGKYIKLKGINKFQDHADLGVALADEYHWQDLKVIKDAGFNSVRLGHFQRSPVVLDACDKLGLIVTCEVPLIDEITLTKEFRSNMINMLYDLVRRDVNHPSIWGWGLSNEILLRMPKKLSNKEKNEYRSFLRSLLIEMDSIVKQEDPYRPTMSVMHLFYALYKRAKIHNIGDIAAINLYPGWYSGSPDQMKGIAKATYEKNPNKPFLITEYGAGADIRLRSDDPIPFDFSLEYQVEVHKQWYQTIKENPFITGSYVWVLSDFNSEKRGDSEPHINSKGLLTYDRIPKDAYYYYKSALSESPVVAIGSKNWSYRVGIENKSEKNVCSQKVEVFSNQKEVELIVNGISLGKQKVNNNCVSWNVPFRDGKNSICALVETSKGQRIIDSHEVNFNLIPRNLKRSQRGLEIRVNAGSNCYFYDNSEKAVWLPNQEYYPNGFGFIGGENLTTKLGRPGRLGVNYDILGTNNDPLFQTQRISPTSFQADVPRGKYEITIGLADLFKKKQTKLAYELGGDKKEDVNTISQESRFSIKINGKTIFPEVCPRLVAGETKALILNTSVYTEDGIKIELVSHEGESYINTIKIIKL